MVSEMGRQRLFLRRRGGRRERERARGRKSKRRGKVDEDKEERRRKANQRGRERESNERLTNGDWQQVQSANELMSERVRECAKSD